MPCVCVGLMITASHNPAQDNGVKIIEPDGSMLNEKWERIADKLVHSENPGQVLEQLCVEENIVAFVDDSKSLRPAVYVGYDSRESSEPLSKVVEKAVVLMGLPCTCFGRVTTPQLHYFVKVANEGVPVSKENYFQRLATAWDTLAKYAFATSDSQGRWSQVIVFLKWSDFSQSFGLSIVPTEWVQKRCKSCVVTQKWKTCGV